MDSQINNHCFSPIQIPFQKIQWWCPQLDWILVTTAESNRFEQVLLLFWLVSSARVDGIFRKLSFLILKSTKYSSDVISVIILSFILGSCTRLSGTFCKNIEMKMV